MDSKGTQPYKYMYSFSQTPLPSRLPRNIEQSSLCYTVGTLMIIHFKYSSVIPNSLIIYSPHPTPLDGQSTGCVTQHLSTSCLTHSSTPKCILMLYFKSQELHLYSWNLLFKQFYLNFYVSCNRRYLYQCRQVSLFSHFIH